MPIIAKDSGTGGSFTPHPEGQYVATCIDVHDLGMLDVTYEGEVKQQHKVDIYWYAGENKTEEGTGNEVTDDDGNPVRLFIRQRFTLSLHEQSRLRPFLEGWRGKAFTDDELAGFDVEKLIGVAALVQISHRKVGDKTYANITSIMKAPKGADVPKIPAEYVRFVDREPEPEQQTAGAGAGQGGSPFDSSADDLPF